MSCQITFHPERCAACEACAVACMDQNDIQVQAGEKPLRRVYTVETTHPPRMDYVSTSCTHCDNAPCILVCPKGCLFQDGETGFTVYDTTQCVGCLRCAAACAGKIPTLGADGKMRKCDGCNERVKAGLLPACVAACPFDALTLTKTP